MVLFLKRSKNTLQPSSAADDVNFLSEQNMLMKCVNTIKETVPRSWRRLTWDKCLEKAESPQLRTVS